MKIIETDTFEISSLAIVQNVENLKNVLNKRGIVQICLKYKIIYTFFFYVSCLVLT